MQTACNECGATLDVAEHTRFIVCPSCQASLRVERQGNSITTEKNAAAQKPIKKKKEWIDLDDLAIDSNSNDPLDRKLEIDRLEREIARLDRQLQNNLIRTQDYNGYNDQGPPPDLRGMGSGPAYLAIICIVVSVVLFFAAGEGVWLYPLPGVLLALLLGIADSLSSGYHNRRQAYETRRRKLMAELRELERK